MDRETRRKVEEYRHNEAGPIENNLIDELVGGELDRAGVPPPRDRCSGSVPERSALLLRYIGEAMSPSAPRGGRAEGGGTIRVGAAAVGSSFEPLLLREAGSLAFAGLISAST